MFCKSTFLILGVLKAWTSHTGATARGTRATMLNTDKMFLSGMIRAYLLIRFDFGAFAFVLHAVFSTGTQVVFFPAVSIDSLSSVLVPETPMLGYLLGGVWEPQRPTMFL